MSLKSEILRHQLLLMKLIGSQAKATQESLNKAKDIIHNAVKRKDTLNLEFRVQRELNKIPVKAMSLVSDVASYEAEYTVNKIKKYTPKDKRENVRSLSDNKINDTINSALVRTTTNGAKRTIEQTYQQFANAKSRQYMQILSDAELEDLDEDEVEDRVEEKTKGLFSTQNLVLAGIALLGISNAIRSDVAEENNNQVDWVLDLELNNCPDCEEWAANGPYDVSEVEGEIPVHANCGCTLVPVL